MRSKVVAAFLTACFVWGWGEPGGARAAPAADGSAPHSAAEDVGSSAPFRSLTAAIGVAAPLGSAATGIADVAPSLAELAQGRHWTGTFTMHLEVWNYCASGGRQLSLAGTSAHTESFSFAA